MQIADLTTPAFYADPYPTYEVLRSAGPIISLGPRAWATGHYSIVDSMLRDRRMGRSYRSGIQARYKRSQDPIFNSFGRMMLFMDPPNHTRLRQLLMKAFNARQQAWFQQLAQTIADKLIDSFPESGTVDIMRDFAVPLPLEVICTLLDVPIGDTAVFNEAVQAIIQNLEVGRMRDEKIDAANLGVTTLEEYFKPILAERRKKPGDDLISLLLLAEENGDQLTEEEIIANIILLFFAGHETTTNMIGNALIALHRHPDQLAKVKADTSMLPSAIAECLRYDASVQVAVRTALEDVQVEGTFIAKGEMIFLFAGAANRDEKKFDNPNELIINRLAQDSTKLLTFGGGVHHCLGVRLALVELEVALGTLFHRLPGMQILNIGNLCWHQRNALRGVESLIVKW